MPTLPPQPAPGTPNLLCQYMANGLRRKLELADHQALPAVAPALDPDWQDFPVVLIVPGNAVMDGSGNGGQDGGPLFRRQYFDLYVYYRLSLDSYGTTQEALTRSGEGLLDFCELVRGVFRYTFFGDADAGTFLLVEPMRWQNEGKPTWEDPDLFIVRKQITYSCLYEEDQPTDVTLTLGDVV